MEESTKKKLTYLLMIIYMLCYYIFVIFFKDTTENFELIRISFESLALIFILFMMAKLNIKGNKGLPLIVTTLLAIIANSIGQVFEVYYKSIKQTDVRNYLVKDGLSIIVSIIFFIVFIHEIHKKRKGRSAAVLTLDIIIIMCMSIAVTLEFVIFPNLTNQTEVTLFSIIVYVFYPLLHLGILAGAIMLYKCMDKDDPERKGIFIFALAFSVMYLANLGYTYLLTKNAYASGNLIDPIWTIYDFLLLVAATEYTHSDHGKPNEDKIHDKANLELNVALPALSTISLFIFVTLRPNRLIWICFGISIVLINIRQVIIAIQKRSLILELEDLNLSLEEKVETRTKEIYKVAFYDHMTGLVNRRLFEELVEELIEEDDKDYKFSILLLDLDRFKTVNDTYGHSFGDLLIQKIAEMLKSLACEKCIISRLGGDEFAIVIKSVEDNNEAEILSGQILRKLMGPIKLNDHVVYTTFSIGIATFPRDGKTFEDIVRCADLAMYHSKHLGRNTYSFYDENMFKSNSRRMTFERELHNAIAEKQFILHYQPQVDAKTKKVIGLEALIRWNHPVQGIISPFQFISIAEETGLIGPIGRWVLESACAQGKVWHDRGYKDLKIGVNISGYQFQQEGFVQMVKRTLGETKMNPKCLDLEITESIAMKNEIAVITKLKELKKLGIKVSMDDFGTGYSSLSYLNRFPIDTLKIPREFVMEIKPYHDKRNIIEAIIAIAKNLELSIIAEGVENEMQLKFLKDRDCDFIQGYLYSKPLPLDMVEGFLKKEL